MRRSKSTSSRSRGVGRAQALLATSCALLALVVLPPTLFGASRDSKDSAVASVQDKGPTEWALKAACLYKFANYVRWPKEALPDDKAPLIVGVLGRDPFGKVLDEMLRDKLHGTHPISVQRFETVEAASKCHILYLSWTEKDIVTDALKALATKPVLLVGEGPAFEEYGGAISFYLESKKLAFTINVSATKTAQLELSSQLLKLAKRTITESGR
ncbi:MAG: YfiR family protein [Planctomycetes bacterium]|nr:YfiR family protein [Planctomycetota bacterium]